MATLTIRNLPEETRRALKARAASHNRSMEAEVRDILTAALQPDTDAVGDWLEAAERLRGEFELPPRSTARPVDLT
jgi:antitoxin FitA